MTPDNQQITINGIGVTLGEYPDGTPVIDHGQIRRYAAGRDMEMTLRPKNLASFMAGMFLCDAHTERDQPINTLILPCLPGARQDRLSSEGDYLFTAKSIAKEINQRDFDRVICFDPHSEVMPALIDRCVAIHADAAFKRPTATGLRGTYAAVIAPDAGAAKRAATVAKVLGVPVLQAWKTRDPKTNKISAFGIEPLDHLPASPNLLIVDDLCDAGGTFLGLADHIAYLDPDRRGHLDLYVSHGMFTKGYDDLTKVFDRIYTTNSTLNPDPTRVDVIDMLATLQGART